MIPSTHPVRAIVVALALACVTAAPAPRRASADAPVEYRDETLSVHVNQMPLDDVLAAVTRATGAEVRGRPRATRAVTEDFEALPIRDALGRLLGGEPFALRYRGTRLVAIELVDSSHAPPPAGTPGPSPEVRQQQALHDGAGALAFGRLNGMPIGTFPEPDAVDDPARPK